MNKNNKIAGILALTLAFQGIPLNALADEIKNNEKLPLEQLDQVDNKDEKIVNIPDKNLENKLIEFLGYKGIKVTSGNITESMLEKFDNSLNLVGFNIENLEGLQYTEVKSLDLGENKLTNEDLSVIKEIKTLETLDLHDNNISDITYLSELNGLKNLRLDNNKIEDISSLEKLANIEELNLENNKIMDISSLSKMSNLKYIKLDGNAITDITPIKEKILNQEIKSRYHERQVIEIEKHVKESDKELKINPEIKGFDDDIDIEVENGVYNEQTGEIIFKDLTKPLSYTFENEENIDAWFKARFSGKVNVNVVVDKKIVNIPDKNLENKLIELLEYKGIKVTSGNITESMLEKFDSSLNLVGFNIENLEGLQYTKVKSLALGENKLTNEDLSVIKEIKTLGVLDLHDNNISNINDLSELSGLKKLRLDNNKIVDISSLEKLTNIKELNLQNEEKIEETLNKNNNKISDIRVLSKMPNLEHIKLDGNAITDITPIKEKILNQEIKSRYHERQVIETEKHIKESDKELKINPEIKGFNDDIDIEVENGVYNEQTGEIIFKDLTKPLSYTFKDECNIDAWFKARFSGKVNVNVIVDKNTDIKPSNSIVPSNKDVEVEEIVGSNRFETALKISEKWEKADNVIITNANSIVDAMAASPFAYAKNAPILLSKQDELSEATKDRIIKLGTKTVYLIGGETVLSKNVSNELKLLGVNVERINGSNRFETSLNIAKELDKIKDISKIAVVNGKTGLADAVSIGSPSAMNHMPIILTDNINISDLEDFIKNEDISSSYVIGGDKVISEKIEKELEEMTNSTVLRIKGENRLETNINVINEFYKDKKLNNLFIVKDGDNNISDLVDALAISPYAAKVKSPVILSGKNLEEKQKELIKNKVFDKITKIGGNGNENTFKEIHDLVK